MPLPVGKKAPLAGAFLFLAAWLALVAAVGAGAGQPVRVERAIDGDTVVLSDQRLVRLIGINSPERGKDGAPDEPLAEAARSRLHALTAGHTVTLIPGEEARDRHGRLLAYVLLPDGRDVQELLLREGLAALVAIPPNVRYLARYQAAADEARAGRRGLWAHPYFAPRSAGALDGTSTGFRFVSGRVTRVWRGERETFLYLDGEVALIVPHADWRHFNCAPETLVGQTLVASGWLTRHRRGWRMRVHHPAMMRGAEQACAAAA